MKLIFSYSEYLTQIFVERKMLVAQVMTQNCWLQREMGGGNPWHGMKTGQGIPLHTFMHVKKDLMKYSCSVPIPNITTWASWDGTRSSWNRTGPTGGVGGGDWRPCGTGDRESLGGLVEILPPDWGTSIINFILKNTKKPRIRAKSLLHVHAIHKAASEKNRATLRSRQVL